MLLHKKNEGVYPCGCRYAEYGSSKTKTKALIHNISPHCKLDANKQGKKISTYFYVSVQELPNVLEVAQQGRVYFVGPAILRVKTIKKKLKRKKIKQCH